MRAAAPARCCRACPPPPPTEAWSACPPPAKASSLAPRASVVMTEASGADVLLPTVPARCTDIPMVACAPAVATLSLLCMPGCKSPAPADRTRAAVLTVSPRLCYSLTPHACAACPRAGTLELGRFNGCDSRRPLAPNSTPAARSSLCAQAVATADGRERRDPPLHFPRPGACYTQGICCPVPEAAPVRTQSHPRRETRGLLRRDS